jgi:hypothetical protein
MITALELLKRAAALGWTFKVAGGDGGYDYAGNKPVSAWNAVKATEEAHVYFFDAEAHPIGWAYLMAPGYGTCANDESLVDYTCDTPMGWLADAIIKEAL